MSKAAFVLCALLVAGCTVFGLGAQTPTKSLTWDALTKEYTTQSGETNAHLRFHVKNDSATEVRTSTTPFSKSFSDQFSLCAKLRLGGHELENENIFLASPEKPLTLLSNS